MPHAKEPVEESSAWGAFSFGRSWRTRGTILLLLVFYLWLVTRGTWRLFATEDYGTFYDYQALAFTHGRLNVPREAVENEAFIDQGKTYGYWGPFPAFLRLPLAVFGKGSWIGHTARTSALVAAGLNLFACLGLLKESRHLLAVHRGAASGSWFDDVCLIGLGGGSTLTFLLARPYVYHESILWGGATGLVALWLGFRYLRTQDFRVLIFSALAGIASALSRPTIGYGVLFGTALLVTSDLFFASGSGGSGGLMDRNQGRRILSIATLLALGITGPLIYNYLRFGEFSPPYRLHVLYDADRLARTNGGHLFQPGNLWTSLGLYLNPAHFELKLSFPFFFAVNPSRVPDHLVLDYFEPYAGALATMTGLAVIGLLGLAAFSRMPRLLALAAGGIVTIVLTCMYACITERYIHDFFPSFAMGTALGCGIAANLSGLFGRGFRFLTTVLILVSVAQFLALGVNFQRVTALPAFDPLRREYEAFGQRTTVAVSGWRDRLFGFPVPLVNVTSWTNLPRPTPGMIAIRATPPGVLWYDGDAWQHLSGVCDEILEQPLELTLPPDGAALTEPLLAVGTLNAATIVFLRTDGSGNWQMACDIWGLSVDYGPSFRPTSRSLSVAILLDRINARVRVTEGKHDLLDLRKRPHPLAGLPLNLGSNPFGGSYCAPKATGEITAVAVHE